MTTLSCTPPYQIRKPNLLPLLVICVAFAAALSAHAIARHASAAEEVNRCIDDADPAKLLTFYDPETGRTLTFCELPSGEYGVAVEEKIGGVWQNITSYPLRAVRTMEQLLRKMECRQCFQVVQQGEKWVPIEQMEVMK